MSYCIFRLQLAAKYKFGSNMLDKGIIDGCDLCRTLFS